VKAKSYGRSSAKIELTASELSLVSNALNEVCNGVRDLKNDDEFATRLGASRENARALLRAFGDLIDRSKALPS